MKETLVLKFGTSSITNDNGDLDLLTLQKVVKEIALLNKSYNLILVSSGAVGTGRAYVKGFSGSIPDRKTAAAIGNPILISQYRELFEPYGITLAQTLFERRHFSNRKQFLQLRDTIHALWDNDIIPIANENDIVSDLELKFSDNDHLASLLAVSLDAKQLLIATAVPGVLDNENKVIPVVNDVDAIIAEFVKDETSSLGLGGMASKLSYAKLASRLGIEVKIFGLKTTSPIQDAVASKSGTSFPARLTNVSARKKWLASGAITEGSIVVDKGARNAIRERNSLLSVGIEYIYKPFSKGELVEIRYNNKPFAIGIAKYHSKNIDNEEKNNIVIHADSIVLL